jgi:16S rRNA (cytidine1402-2'-O)-methyltransferase
VTGEPVESPGAPNAPEPDSEHVVDGEAEEEVEDDTSDEPQPASPHPRDRRSTLSIVSTPIGNLEDITLRALRTLREADLVLAEDTRRTRVLCQHHGLHCQLRSFHAHSSPGVLEHVLTELEAGKHVALVTDAGTPLLSDPGASLVSAAHDRGLRVETIPGPSAITAALTVAGLQADHFRFLGFVARSGRRRREAFAQIAHDTATSVLFESPRRLVDTLRELAQLLGPLRRLAVCRELTKLHEEVVRGTALELAEHFQAGVRGEITLLVEGRAEGTQPEYALAEAGIGDGREVSHGASVSNAEALEHRIAQLREAGTSTRDAAALLARETGLRKQTLYARIEASKAKAAAESDRGADADQAPANGRRDHP